MKTVGKQEADSIAVRKFLKNNKGMNLKQAFAAVAEEHGKKVGTVQASYYMMIRKQQPNKVAAPVKTKPVKKRVKVAANTDLDMNIRAVLAAAISTIDALEARNNKNEQIISNLRNALV